MKNKKEPFTEVDKDENSRIVYIFTGRAGTGKYFLASKMGVEVFDTDTIDVLPDKITATIVVLGNRLDGFTIDDIKSKLFGETYVQIVEFI